MATPSSALVDAYLREIAKAYGVPWSTPDELTPVNSDEDVKVRYFGGYMTIVRETLKVHPRLRNLLKKIVSLRH